MENETAFAQADFDLRLQTASGLITHMYQIHLTELRHRTQVDAFCQRHRLHRIQYYLDEKILNIACDTLDDRLFFVISDVFLLHFILFSVRGIPYVLGPFCPEHLTAVGASAVIRQYGLTELSESQVLAYCSAYPSMSERQAQNLVTSLIHAIYPREPDKLMRRISNHAGTAAAEIGELAVRANHNTLIERRYATERQMIEYIKQGDARSAIHQLHLVEQDVSYLKKLAPTIERERIGAAIFRTTVRHAAMESGLPALVIDQITSQNDREVAAAPTEQTILLAKEQLVRQICQAIREAREHRYSALVQNTLYHFEHEYRNEISIENLSAEFGVTADHLIASFKKETGKTPNAWLTQLRMKKAANLLINGSASVGNISMAVGIMDPNYFVKLFKKEFGETPTAFRRRYTI